MNTLTMAELHKVHGGMRPVSGESTGGIIGGAVGTLACWELGPGSVICGAAGAYAGSWLADNNGGYFGGMSSPLYGMEF